MALEQFFILYQEGRENDRIDPVDGTRVGVKDATLLAKMAMGRLLRRCAPAAITGIRSSVWEQTVNVEFGLRADIDLTVGHGERKEADGVAG